MITKLTLTLDDKVIREAKRYAKKTGRSVSELVENYFKSITKIKDDSESEELAPIVKSLMGSFKAPKDFDYKKILEEKRRKYE